MIMWGPSIEPSPETHMVGSLDQTDFWPCEWTWRACQDEQFIFCEGHEPWYSNVDCSDYPACRCYSCGYWYGGGMAGSEFE